MTRLLPPEPFTDLDSYRRDGGGAGLSRALTIDPAEVIDVVRRSGLRGRGGAGFPTGVKWSGVASTSSLRAVVCNAAEGEPGTRKDRAILDANPYAVIEGLAIAAHAMGAPVAYIGVKAKFVDVIGRLERAASEMSAAGMLEHVDLRIVEGPDDYLFGVETAMLEVIEGRDPLPRIDPPWVRGVTGTDGVEYATAVNNVETLANVPGIIARGAEWFRSVGTEGSPGTMVFTVSGDVTQPGVVELAMGTPLSYLVHGPGGGTREGRVPKLIVSGVSNRPLSSAEMDTPLSFEAMAAIGSGLGSGGFVVYDDSTCAVEVGAVLSGFLQVGSCGQCPPCKLGTTAFADGFGGILDGRSSLDRVEEMAAWLSRVTDANRCGLGAGQRALAYGILEAFADDVVACLEGRCPGHRGLLPPMLD